MTDPVAIDDFLVIAVPRRRSVRLVLDQPLVVQHEQLQVRLNETTGSDAALEVAEQLREVEQQLSAAEREFVFVCIGAGRWKKLKKAHELSLDDRRRLGIEFDPMTFPIAAIAASCESPTMSEQDVERLMDTVNDAQWLALWSACVDVCVGTADSPRSHLAEQILSGRAR